MEFQGEPKGSALTSRTGQIGLLLTVASLVLLCASIWQMQRKLSTRSDLKDRPVVWFNEPIVEPSFRFQDVPCEVRTVTTEAGEKHVEIDWRGRTVTLPVGGRDDERLPKMLRHEDWLKILPMAEERAGTQDQVIEKLVSGQTKPRLIVAARYPAEGFNSGSWGLVRRRDWRYRFIELRVDGPAEESVVEYATTYREIERIVAPGPRDQPIEGLTDRQREEAAWQYYAMLQVTPAPLYRAKDKVVEQGMRAMGWTWPAAGTATMGLIVGLGLLMSSRVARSSD